MNAISAAPRFMRLRDCIAEYPGSRASFFANIRPKLRVVKLSARCVAVERSVWESLIADRTVEPRDVGR